MKDDTSTPTSDGTSPNEFGEAKPGITARDAAEAAIEDLRKRGGVFVNAVRATRMPMVLTDPNLPANPIVFANEAFLKLSGYSLNDVLGQQPHFMNDPHTDPKDARRFTEAIRADQDDIIETVQYRKNGSRFVATVLISGFKDENGRTLNHFMSWLDVTRRVDAEDEVADLKKAQGELQKSEEKYRDLFKSMDEAYAVVEVLKDDAGKWVDFRFLEVNPAFTQHTTMPNPVGKTATELLGTPNPRWTELYGRALDGGKPLRIEESEVTLGLTFDLNIFALDRANNRVAILFTNITERKQAEAALLRSERHAKTLLAELQHRVRNTLGVVRSIARRTADRSENIEDFHSHFEGRLNAFARVQSAVTRSASGAVQLQAILDDELLAVATREGSRLRIKGPTVWLKSKPAESISLAIHELATNAVKYGALGESEGCVDVRWKRVADHETDELHLEWTETGLAEPPGPICEGFGHEMLRRMLPYDLGAETNIEFTPDSMRFTMRMPLGPEVLAE